MFITNKYANIEKWTPTELKNKINSEREWYDTFKKLNTLIMIYADQIGSLNKNKESIVNLLKHMPKKGEKYKELSESFLRISIELVFLKEKKQNVINLMNIIVTHIEQPIIDDQQMSCYQLIDDLFGSVSFDLDD